MLQNLKMIDQGKRHKDEITSVFTKLRDQPPLITDIEMNILEQFVIEIYSVSKSFKYPSLGEMRLQKFITSTDNNLRNLPLSRDALLQHAKRQPTCPWSFFRKFEVRLICTNSTKICSTISHCIQFHDFQSFDNS